VFRLRRRSQADRYQSGTTTLAHSRRLFGDEKHTAVGAPKLSKLN
jgi:hypothetical protein